MGHSVGLSQRRWCLVLAARPIASPVSRARGSSPNLVRATFVTIPPLVPAISDTQQENKSGVRVVSSVTHAGGNHDENDSICSIDDGWAVGRRLDRNRSNGASLQYNPGPAFPPPPP